jgi:hypothetical protein
MGLSLSKEWSNSICGRVFDFLLFHIKAFLFLVGRAAWSEKTDQNGDINSFIAINLKIQNVQFNNYLSFRKGRVA